MAWRGSVSRSLMSTARSSAFRSTPSLSAHGRVRPPQFSPSRPRFSFSNPRTLGELGCTQSLLLPLHSVAVGGLLTCHLAVSARACCELYHGICRSCPDR